MPDQTAKELASKFYNDPDMEIEQIIEEGISIGQSLERERVRGVVEKMTKNIPIILMQDGVSFDFTKMEGYQEGVLDISQALSEPNTTE